jgi:SAM-dependent methyltransferase
MDPEAIRDMGFLEDHHWWFKGRRAIVSHMLERLPLPQNARILEAGCGTGGNLAMLASFGQVYGFEPDENARKMALARGIGQIEEGFLPDPIPFSSHEFDLVIATDVLEHVEFDQASVGALASRLKPGGYFVATVPACPSLWSQHDVVHHHYRRYTRRSLSEIFSSCNNLKLQRCSYFNAVLFPAVFMARKAKALFSGSSRADTNLPMPIVNASLFKLFQSEHLVLRYGGFPVGVSLLLVAVRV